MNSIQAVVWDFGGVIVRTQDYSSRDRLATRLGLSRQQLETLVFLGKSGQQAQLGETNIDQHWETVRKELGLSSKELEKFHEEFWGGDRLDNHLVNLIHNLRPTLKTGLLSNHFSSLRLALKEEWSIEDAFDAIVISAEVGIVKPDPRIYRMILKQLDSSADQTIFIDDFPHNLDGAQKVGMKTILFQSTDQVCKELNQLLKPGGQF